MQSRSVVVETPKTTARSCEGIYFSVVLDIVFSYSSTPRMTIVPLQRIANEDDELENDFHRRLNIDSDVECSGS